MPHVVVLELTAGKNNFEFAQNIETASSGALCGIMDIFLVGKPGESPIGDLTDKWFAERTKSFAKLCKWDSTKDDSLKSAIKHL